MPFLAAIRSEGVSTIGGVMLALNARRLPAPTGERWYVSTVANLLTRVVRLERARAGAL